MPTLFCDCMLGRLARWLRLLGNQVIYHRAISDEQILKEITETKNYTILLTRDENLWERCHKRNLKCLQVQKDLPLDQLSEILNDLRGLIRIQPLSPLCPLCSGNLVPIKKSDVILEIPSFISHVYHDFWLCDNFNCQKLYWRGIKWRDFIKMIVQYIENHIRLEMLEFITTSYLKSHRWVVWTLHGLGDGFLREKDSLNAKIAYETALNLSSKIHQHERTKKDDLLEREILSQKFSALY
ncbi:MAG: Mut7-C RNAse domain-containing protein [Candidatus Hodarchaeota archaeon]